MFGSLCGLCGGVRAGEGGVCGAAHRIWSRGRGRVRVAASRSGRGVEDGSDSGD